MTVLPPPVRLFFALLAFALILGACSSDGSTDEAFGGGPLPTKDAPSSSEADDETDAETPEEGSTDVTMPSSDDGQSEDTSTTAPDSEPPVSPPGTVNDLDDLIGNEDDEGLDRPRGGTRVERFVVALLADTGDLDVSEADALCAGEALESQLSETSFELLVTNLETLNELEDGTQFSVAELTVISESFAGCIDFRPLVDELVGDDVSLAPLVSCLAAEIGVDGVEALLLFEVLGENGDRLTTPIYLRGLELCPSEARVAIDAVILDQFLLADAPKIEACLAAISTAELRPFFETREFSELITQLREQCLF